MPPAIINYHFPSNIKEQFMSLNFVDTIKEYYSPDFNDQAAKLLNESQQGISNALSAIIPVGLDGILNIATSGKEGANIIFDMAKSGADFLSEFPDVENLQKGKETYIFISAIFGNNEPAIIDAVSKYAGIQNASTSSLMALVIPATMRFLGKHAEKFDLSASGLSGFLSSQHNNISRSLPSDLLVIKNIPVSESLNALKQNADITKTIKVTKTINEVKMMAGAEKPKSERGMKWLLPVFVVIIIIALIYYFNSR